MIYSINYTNNQSFMKEWAKDPGIKLEKDGRTSGTGMVYRKASVPGTTVNFAPKFADGKMQIALSQEELNQAVEDLNFFDKEGTQIKTAPLGTNNHAFWKSEHAYLFIEGGEARLDDSEPKGKIMLAAMRKDIHFYFLGENGKPPVASMVKWTVKPIDSKHTAIVEDEANSMQAVKFLLASDYEKQLNILNCMGRQMSDKTDPEVIQSTLYRMITTDRDLFASEGVTNLQKFTTLAKGSNEDVNVLSLVNNCKKYFEKRQGYYYYGEIRLGKTMEEIALFLKTDIDLLHELSNKVK